MEASIGRLAPDSSLVRTIATLLYLGLVGIWCEPVCSEDTLKASRLAKKKRILDEDLGVPVPAAALVLNSRLASLHNETIDAVLRFQQVRRRRLPRRAESDALRKLVEKRGSFLHELMLMKAQVEADLKQTESRRQELLDDILPAILVEKSQAVALEHLLSQLEDIPDLGYRVDNRFWSALIAPEIGEDVRTPLRHQAARLQGDAASREQREQIFQSLSRAIQRFIDQGNKSVGKLQRQVQMIRSLRQTERGISIDLAPLLRICLRKNLTQQAAEKRQLAEWG